MSPNHFCQRTRPTPSPSAQPEQSDALVVRSLHENTSRKEVLCSYCERKSHNEAQCQKKYRDTKQRGKSRPNTARTKIATVNEFGLGHRQAKDKNLTYRQ